MVSLDNIHVVGSFYMGLHGGFKPEPRAFIHYLKANGLKPKKIFFLGNRLVDMELADKLSKRLDCKSFKCLLLRGNLTSLGQKKADAIAKNLWTARQLIDKFKPDLVMSDFDNTLVSSGYSSVESIVESTRFWERHSRNRLLRALYSLGSQLSIPFIRRRPYNNRYDNTESFIKTLKTPLLIHSMSPELVIAKTIKEIIK
ncbi:MAG: hypothetical protein WC307_01130 [Candidatus Nanoarchaeia archaeon]|jgi:hypothetical protein